MCLRGSLGSLLLSLLFPKGRILWPFSSRCQWSLPVKSCSLPSSQTRSTPTGQCSCPAPLQAFVPLTKAAGGLEGSLSLEDTVGCSSRVALAFSSSCLPRQGVAACLGVLEQCSCLKHAVLSCITAPWDAPLVCCKPARAGSEEMTARRALLARCCLNRISPAVKLEWINFQSPLVLLEY